MKDSKGNVFTKTDMVNLLAWLADRREMVGVISPTAAEWESILSVIEWGALAYLGNGVPLEDRMYRLGSALECLSRQSEDVWR